MDTGQTHRDLSVPPWRRALLLSALLALGGVYVAAFAVFVSGSEDFVARRIDARARDYALAHPLTAPAALRWGADESDRQYLGVGWHAPDPGGVWSARPESTLYLAVTGSDDVDLEVAFDSFVASGHERLRVRLEGNGRLLAQWQPRIGDSQVSDRLRLPRAVFGRGAIALRWRVDTPASPYVLRTGGDTRRLGIRLTGLSVVEPGTGAPQPPDR